MGPTGKVDHVKPDRLLEFTNYVRMLPANREIMTALKPVKAISWCMKIGFCVGLSGLPFNHGILAATDVNEVDPRVPDAQRLSRMRSGEILVDEIKRDSNGGFTRVQALVFTPPERIWDLVFSCEAAFRFVQSLRYCEVLEDDARHWRARQSIKTVWFFPRLDFVLEAQKKPHMQISFHEIEGDLEVMEGQWLLQRLAGENAVLLTYEIRMKPRMPAPKWLIRRNLRNDLPNMLACIRGLADGSISDVIHAQDMRRCQH